MLYVLTEDSKDGYKLICQLKEIYLDSLQNQVTVESFNGIWGVAKKIEAKVRSSNSDDLFIVVVDNVIENPLIEKNLRRLHKYIKDNNLRTRVKVLPTHSFELELLLMKDIELLCNIGEYKKYFSELRELFYTSATKDIKHLTAKSKSEHKYDDWYSKAREEKIKIKEYAELSAEDFEKAITIETLSKRILNTVFSNNGSLSKPMSKPCWGEEGCNCKRSKCKPYLDKQKLLNDPFFKVRWIIQNSNFLALIKKMEEMTGKQLYNESILDLKDMLSVEVAKANRINMIIKGEWKYAEDYN